MVALDTERAVRTATHTRSDACDEPAALCDEPAALARLRADQL